MGKISYIKNALGNVVYPVTVGDAVAVDGKTLTTALSGKADKANITGATKTKITYNAQGIVTAGADLEASDIPNLSASKITSGTFADARIASAETWNAKQDALVFNTAYDASTNKVATMSDVSDAVSDKQDTLVFNTEYNASTNKAATMSDISSALTSALKYKGSVNKAADLPATHSVGDVYVVATAGTYVGLACEVGDYIICKADGTAANDAHWDVINGENQVSADVASTATGAYKIGTVDGTNLYGINTTYSDYAGAAHGLVPAKSSTTASASKVLAETGAWVDLPTLSSLNAQDKIEAQGILKGDGNTVSAAIAGTDYLAPVTAVTDATADSATTKSTQIITNVTQSTDGQIAVTKSAYTIAKSVPSDAVFTDTKDAASLTCTSDTYGGATATTSVQTALNNLATAVSTVTTDSLTAEALTTNTTEYSDSKIAAIVNVAAADTTIQ